MNKLLLSVALGLSPSIAIAQNCIDQNLGTQLGSFTYDVVFPIQPIGFSFSIGGVSYSDIHVTTHGFVTLSNAGIPVPPGVTTLYDPTMANFLAGAPKIAALYTDVVVPQGAVYLNNSSPSKCVITWKDAETYGSAGPLFDMQMTLFPNGDVKIYYSVGATNNSTFGGSSDNGIVGITPAGGAVAPAGSDLSAGGASANTTVYENWLLPNQFDMANNNLYFAATSPGYGFFLLGAPANCASVDNYGTGCGGNYDSVYQDFNSTSFDLSNQTISFLRTSTGYVATTALPGVFVAPTAAALPVGAGALDGQTAFTLSSAMPVPGGTTTTLNVTTKGQVELGGAQLGIDWTPTPADLLAWPNTAFHCWHDFNQSVAGSGIITFEEAGGFAFATWDNVYSISSSLPNTMQFQFELATGNVTLVIGTCSGITDPSNADLCVVGYSVGGASADPGATDFSTLVGVVTIDDVGGFPLALTSFGGTPAIGQTAFGYSLSNVPAIVPLAFLFFGDTVINPGIDLSFLGMSGCNAHSNGNLGSFTVGVASGTGTMTLPIPNNPGLVGVELTTQGVAFSTATAAGLVTSNGTHTVVGY